MAPPQHARPFLGKCQWCREIGHVVAYCPLFRQQHSAARPPTLPKNPSPHTPPQAHTANTASASQNFIVDSGATHHVVNDLDQLSLHYPYNGPDELFMGSGEGLRITNSGTLSLNTSASMFKLADTLCVPQMTKNIISVSQLSTQQNCAIVFLPNSFHVKCLKTGRILLNGPCRDGLYMWPTSSPTVLSSSRDSNPQWHHALGHPSSATFKLIQQQLQISSPTFEQSDCTSCQLNKSHKLPFHNSSLCSNYFLEVIFSDVWTSPILSYDGFKYYVVFVDHFTRYTWIYPLKRKSDVQNTFIKFWSLVENYFKTKIKVFYSDNGGEFISLKNFLSQHGISHFTSPPHTPEHNGISERKHSHIVETGLALLTHSGMPLEFWPHALLTAVYLINRLPTPTLQNRSPFSIIFKQNADYVKLKSFGCLCFPWLKPYTSHKLESRSVVCVFVGYSTTQHAYYCMDPKTRRVYTSRHIKFVETEFPFWQQPKTTQNSEQHTNWTTLSVPILPCPRTLPSPSQSASSYPSYPPTPSPGSLNSTLNPPNSPSPTSSAGLSQTNPLISPSSSISSPFAATPSTSQSSYPEPQSTPPPTQIIPDRGIVTRSQNNIFKPLHKMNLSATPHPPIEPRTITQALKDRAWREAMQKEYDALCANNTWTLVPPHPTQNLVGSKWVFRTKYLPDGSIDRLKARLVAKGFHQRPRWDFHETFSLVVKPVTVRVILTLAVSKGWHLRQLDINNAFLQGSLSEEVYVCQPPGFTDPSHPNHVCRLNKALYGLRQAPRAWYTELRSFLLKIGFVTSAADASLFIHSSESIFLVLLVYVDDIIVTGNTDTAVTQLVQRLAAQFSLKDLGTLSYFLGVEVIPHHSGGLFLSQRKYISDVLIKAGMEDAKPVTTPLSASTPLLKTEGEPLPSPTDYRCIVGSLQYLA